MLHNYQYELINDLYKKLSLYKNNSFEKDIPYTFKNLKAQKLSNILLHSKLNFKLDSETIDLFLKGKKKIRKLSSGKELSIKSSLTREELEKESLLWFIDGKARVPYSYNDQENIEIFKTINNLSSLIYGKDDFERSELVVTIDKILHNEEEINILEQLIKKDENIYTFQFSSNDIKPIGSELWKLLYSKNKSKKDAFEKWIYLMSNAFDYNGIVDLDFENEKLKDDFLDESVDYILNSDELKETWYDIYKKLCLEANRHHFSIYSTNIELPNELRKLNPENNILDAFLWWNNRAITDRIFPTGITIYEDLIYFVIINDVFVYNEENSFSRTKKLFNDCQSRPFLAGQLLTTLFNDSLIPFYLSNSETLTIGMKHILSNNNLPTLRTNSNDYVLQWKEMIWNQSIEVFFSFFEKFIDIQKSSNIISNLLILMVENHYSMKQEQSFYLNNVLKFFEKVMVTQVSNHPKQSLLRLTLPTISKKIINSNIGRGLSFQLPYEKIHLLLWLLNKSHKESLEIGENDDFFQLNTIIISDIINLYQSSLMYALKNHGLSEDSIMDRFDWSLLVQLSTNKQKESLFNSSTTLISNKDYKDDDVFHMLHTIRVHFRFLLNLYKISVEKDKVLIENALVIIVKEYTDNTDWKKNIFQPFLEKNEHNLIGMFLEFFNQFHNDNRKEILACLLNNTSIANIFEVLKYSTSTEIRKEVFKKLKTRQIGEEDFSHMSEIIDTLVLTLNENELEDYSEPLLDILENNQKSDHFKKIYKEIKYKKDLLKIFNQKVLQTKDKIKKLNKVENPFNDRKNFGNFKHSMQEDMERYRRFIIALVYFDEEPEKTYKILKAILSDSVQPIYALNMLIVRYRLIDKNDFNYIDLYKAALFEWEELSKKFENHILDENEYLILLEGYQVINDFNKFSFYWNTMPEYLHNDLDFVPIRCKFLQQQQMSTTALKYLEEIFLFHNEIEKSKKDELERIKEGLLNDVEVAYKSKKGIQVSSSLIVLSPEQAKGYWLKIKDMIDEYHAKIFPRQDLSLEEFILENMRLISLELLERKENIKNKSKKLFIEDMINDWVTSLINQRMGFINWSARDQSRGGNSSSGKSAGERDIIVSNQSKDDLFLIEAFRLFGCSRQTIKSHMDKLDGYNAKGCNVVVVLVYCKVKEFFTLCNNYKNYLVNQQYKGFDNTNLSNNIFDEIDSKKVNLKIFKEIRKKNNKEITLYHLLSDFE